MHIALVHGLYAQLNVSLAFLILSSFNGRSIYGYRYYRIRKNAVETPCLIFQRILWKLSNVIVALTLTRIRLDTVSKLTKKKIKFRQSRCFQKI